MKYHFKKIGLCAFLVSILVLKPGETYNHVRLFDRQTVSPVENVVLIVWDGSQRRHVFEMLDNHALPHLENIIEQGALRLMEINTENCRCTGDGDNYHTETGPAHAAMLTGYGFPVTKNHANRASVEKEDGDCTAYCPDGSNPVCWDQLGPHTIPKGLTVFERLKKQYPRLITGMITGKDHKFFPFPAFQNAASMNVESPDTGLRGMGTEFVLDVCMMNFFPPQIETPLALDFLSQYKNQPFFLFLHYKEPDEVGHLYGENSNHYTQALIEVDMETGLVVNKLQELGIYEKTIVLVTTDHGFVEGDIQHHDCVPDTKNLWIACNRDYVIKKQVRAVQTSIVPTIFDIFGMDKNVTPPFSGSSLFVHEYSVTIEAESGGSTIPSPGEYEYEEDSTAVITAVPNTHYSFLYWSGSSNGSVSPLSLKVDSDKTLTAHFQRNIYPPVNSSGRKVINRSLSLVEYINEITWESNPNNEHISHYRVYRYDNGIRHLLIETDNSVGKMIDRNVKKDDVMVYEVCAVNVEDREGEPGVVVIQ
ncbi:MAG: alkaline phosphatase family protein [Candidatus Aminicenantes bacterium]|nr:alkaline phosphatase family protein [Candidatus Aminicenantes bacterium]